MAATYTELLAEVQSWLDNDTPSLIAVIPSFVQDAEKRLSRMLRTMDQECTTRHALVPNGVTEDTRGRYVLPSDWREAAFVFIEGDEVGMSYYQAIPTLDDTVVTTNWLLDRHPDLYRYAALVSAEPWLKNDPRTQLWATMAQEITNEIVQEDKLAQVSGGPLRSRDLSSRPWVGHGRTGGRLETLSPADFSDLQLSGVSSVPEPVVGYCTFISRELRIWPRPGGDPTADAGWSACP